MPRCRPIRARPRVRGSRRSLGRRATAVETSEQYSCRSDHAQFERLSEALARSRAELAKSSGVELAHRSIFPCVLVHASDPPSDEPYQREDDRHRCDGGCEQTWCPKTTIVGHHRTMATDEAWLVGVSATSPRTCGRVDFSPGPPQIRTCRIPASGSSTHGFAARRQTSRTRLEAARAGEHRREGPPCPPRILTRCAAAQTW
jgi:hypothetical protein